jgi:hypothetical protein
MLLNWRGNTAWMPMTEDRDVELPGARPDASQTTRRLERSHPISSKPKLEITDLKRILARHRGWLTKSIGTNGRDEPLPEHDHFLEQVPAYEDWREEALTKPAQADLSNTDLSLMDLSGASVSLRRQRD